VIEAIVEKMEVKQAVLAEVEALLPPHAILMTNTSSLDIDAMASRMRDPSRLVGLHFFNRSTACAGRGDRRQAHAPPPWRPRSR